MTEQQSKLTTAGLCEKTPAFYNVDPSLKPFHSIDDKDAAIETRSTESTASSLPHISNGELSEVTTTLHIAAHGVPVIRLPMPSNELNIPVYNSAGDPVYTSVRSKRCSNSCTLSHEKLGDLLSTTYVSGFTDPVITYLSGSKSGQVVQVQHRYFTRTTCFTDADGKTYQWKYEKTKDVNGKRTHMIVLREVMQVVVDDGEKRSNGGGRIIARLVRDKENRTPGTSSSTAGNGGRLDIYESADEAVLDEGVIVATCILMLKRELDRRRALQMAMIVSVV